ncbi:MAG TPA: hypothetical protein VK929_04365 [Longimicrobiales bacterium]|nr:hypothetical protein [Longimicrobiales bacterium]
MAALLGLGALHGINPAMGWLFAAALGLQERSTMAVWRALPPLALGHALSVAAFAAAAAAAGTLLTGPGVRVAMAALLIVAGMHRLWRGHVHFRYGGMRMTGRQLVIWSFLMATAHGAGLMVIPFLSLPTGGSAAAAAAHGAHGHHVAAAGPAAGDLLLAGQAAGLVASLLHTASYLATAGLLAVVVYRQAAFRVLRTAWINLDVIWAAALIVTGILVAMPLLAGA